MLRAFGILVQSAMKLFDSIRLQNFLSFGSEGVTLPLQSLNVLIGTNGSGKSNLIEAFRILQAAPIDISSPFRNTGTIDDWLWKGKRQRKDAPPTATVDAVLTYPRGDKPLCYTYSFTSNNNRRELVDEVVANTQTSPERSKKFFQYRHSGGLPMIWVAELPQETLTAPQLPARYRILNRETFNTDQSILFQIKDPVLYPELNYLSTTLPRIRIYTEWSKGRYAAFRQPQDTDLPGDFLSEDFANLPLVVNYLDSHEPDAMVDIMETFGRFYEGIESIKTSVQAHTIQLFLKEKGFASIPATRLSDGTLNFLCLCVVLLHPKPPPLIILDEPELGLHPDIITLLGEMLIKASERTQLIVTTHSVGLIDAIGETSPESVVVCERHTEGTSLERLSADAMKEWLGRYSLGELWTKGEIGGNRW